jgi:hypothetical protein
VDAPEDIASHENCSSAASERAAAAAAARASAASSTNALAAPAAAAAAAAASSPAEGAPGSPARPLAGGSLAALADDAARERPELAEMCGADGGRAGPVAGLLRPRLPSGFVVPASWRRGPLAAVRPY